jgi:hypothetical protein
MAEGLERIRVSSFGEPLSSLGEPLSSLGEPLSSLGDPLSLLGERVRGEMDAESSRRRCIVAHRMLRLRVTYAHAAELRRTLDEELARGVLLLKITPPEDLEFRAPLAVELVSPGGTLAVDSEVVSILPGVGVAVAFPAARLPEARALLADTPAQPEGAAVHEIVPAEPGQAVAGGVAASAAAAARTTFANKVHLALHGSRDDRAAILRDQNRQLHPFVLKSPHVTFEEVGGWAGNAQMSGEFLKLIADRKEWLSRPAIALGLARNPKTPPEVALRALEYVPAEALRQMAKGVGALPHVVQAARKRIVPR